VKNGEREKGEEAGRSKPSSLVISDLRFLARRPKEASHFICYSFDAISKFWQISN